MGMIIGDYWRLFDVLVERYLVVERDYSAEEIGCGSMDGSMDGQQAAVKHEISRSSSTLCYRRMDRVLTYEPDKVVHRDIFKVAR